jgi:hypothetical protein
VSENDDERNSKRTSPPRRRSHKHDPERAAEELRCSVAQLQALVRRVLAMAEDDLELDELLKVLNTTSSTCSRIARLLKMDPAQAGMDPLAILTRSMDEAIEALRSERGWR